MTSRCVWTVGAARHMAAGLLALALLCGCAPRKPNVLLITLDTTRADHLGCYGHTNAVTPALDKLAAEGVRFDNAQSVAPITLPAHASLLTGLLPPEHGIRINLTHSLPEDVPTITEAFKAAGYRTGAMIAFSVLDPRHGLNRGFDVYDAPAYDPEIKRIMQTIPALMGDNEKVPYRKADEIVDRAIAWLKKGRSRQPWFLWAHFYDPHFPLHWNRKAVGSNFFHPYDAEIAYMDQQIARLLAFIDASGQRPDTLVAAVADHGEGLEEHGEPSHLVLIYEATMRIPLILQFPGRIGPGKVVNAPVSLVQVAPSLLDLAGIEPHPALRDFWEGLTHLPDRPEEGCRADSLIRKTNSGFLVPDSEPGNGTATAGGIYMESDFGFLTFNWAPLRSLRQGDWKYIRAPTPELYRLTTDPRELNNLSQTSESNRLAAMERDLSDLEDLMIHRAGENLKLNREELRIMASMGYLAGGGQASPDRAVDPLSLPDPKQVVHASVWAAHITQLEGRGDFGDETLKLARETVKLSPGTAQFHAQLARILDHRGQNDEALESWNRTLALDASQADTWNGKALALVKLNREPEALPCFREAHRLEPDVAEARRNLILALNNIARRATNERQFKIADALIDEGAALEPDNPGWNLSRAGVRLAAGERDTAIAILRKTLADNPDYRPATEALKQLGVLIDKGQERH